MNFLTHVGTKNQYQKHQALERDCIKKYSRLWEIIEQLFLQLPVFCNINTG